MRPEEGAAREGAWMPGPGHYDPSPGLAATQPAAPAARFSEAPQRPPEPRERAAAEVPAPGTYDVPPPEAGPSTSFGREAQRPMEPAAAAAQLVPGVGRYDPEEGETATRRAAPAFSMGLGARPAMDLRTYAPGVGSYEVGGLVAAGGRAAAPGVAMPRAPRDALGLFDRPPAGMASGVGPGRYSLPEPAQRAAAFAAAEQRPPSAQLRAAAETPGAKYAPPPPYRSPYASPYRTPPHPPLLLLFLGTPWPPPSTFRAASRGGRPRRRAALRRAARQLRRFRGLVPPPPPPPYPPSY